MALGLVDIQNFFCLQIQRTIEQRQPLRDILVYGGFADTELLCGGADCGFVLDDVLCQQNGSLFDVSLQEATLPVRD